MANAVDTLVNAKISYLKSRGGTADPASPSKMVPKTTFGDVIAFGMTFLSFVSAGPFVVTQSYASAYARFIKAMPAGSVPSYMLSPSWRMVGNSPTAASSRAFADLMASKYEMFANVTYPNNLEFWRAAENLAISRGGAGAVPGSLSIAAEAIADSVKGLPARLARAADAVPGVKEFKLAMRIGAFVVVGWGVWMIIGPSVTKRFKQSQTKELAP